MTGNDPSQSSHEKGAHELLPLVYEELRRLARHKMSNELTGQTLQATALVHEAYLRLIASGERPWKSRRYFFAAAAEAMRRILIEKARTKHAQRRGGGILHADLDEIEMPSPMPAEELLALDAVLEKYARVDPEKAELVKLKFFVGLTTADAAALLGISEPTAKRYWAFSRAWLFRQLAKDKAS
jgi:RNA polymerase sigma factor (TIGR02999 family)